MMQAERSAIAQAAKAKAEVEARYSMAMLNRRDMDDVRARLLKDCQRPEFAKAARYKIPNRGEGFTIRFAESAMAHLGNMYVSAPCIVEDEYQRTICVTVMDLERNVTWTKDVVILKTIERKDHAGREVVRFRQKADGGTIAIVRATDEELLTKENSLVSKASRTGIERVIPPDLKAECLLAINTTIAAKIKDDPDSERKEIADAFLKLNILPSHLKEYLETELSQVAPAELAALRELYTAIREGHTTWRDVMAAKRAEDGADEEPGSESLKDKLKRATGAPAGDAKGSQPTGASTPATDKSTEKQTNGGESQTQSGTSTGISIGAFNSEEFKSVQAGLKSLGHAQNRPQLEEFLGKFRGDKIAFMRWLEEELQAKAGLKKD